MQRIVFAVVSLVAITSFETAEAGAPPRHSIRLYQPDDVLVQRIGDDAGPLAQYIKALQAENVRFWVDRIAPAPQGLLIAVGVKPGGVTKVWCDPVEGTVPKESIESLEKMLQAVPAPRVKGGPLAFAIEVRLTPKGPTAFPELPIAWRKVSEAATKPLLVPDGIFFVLWP